MISTIHIVLAMKSIEGTYAENALRYGVGGLNIDECRTEGGWTRKATPGTTPYGSEKTWHLRVEGENSTTHDMDRGAEGRFPANVIIEENEDIIKKFPNVRGMSGGGAKDKNKKEAWIVQPYNRQIVRKEWVRGDDGSAARFYKQIGEHKE